MDLSGIKQWVRTELGEDNEAEDCGVDVELTDRMIKQSLNNAIEWWTVYHGVFREVFIDFVTGQSEYDLSGISPGVESVKTVLPPNDAWHIDYSNLYPGLLDVNLVPYNSDVSFGSPFAVSGMYQTRQMLEMHKRAYGTDFSWDLLKYNNSDGSRIRTLRTYPASGRTGKAYIAYKVEPEDLSLNMFSQKELFIIRDYTLASCKRKLGRIRSKYSSLPTPGGERQLDGEQLLAEAKDEMMELEERIKNTGGPIPLVVG